MSGSKRGSSVWDSREISSFRVWTFILLSSFHLGTSPLPWAVRGDQEPVSASPESKLRSSSQGEGKSHGLAKTTVSCLIFLCFLSSRELSTYLTLAAFPLVLLFRFSSFLGLYECFSHYFIIISSLKATINTLWKKIPRLIT